MPKRDWITEMNDLADLATPKQDDRMVLEEMIMWLNGTGLGPRFVNWYRDVVGTSISNRKPIEKLVVQ